MVCLQGPGPRVSVLMTVYNGARFVREAADSILSQNFTDFEFLIVDDGSTDQTPAILREMAAGDRRVALIAQEHLGIPRSRNRGIMLARGAFVALQDADDISLPDRLARQVAYLDRFPHCAMVGSFSRLINGVGEELHDMAFPFSHDDIRAALPNHFCFQNGSLMFRRAALLAMGGYRVEFPVCEDFDLCCRISEKFVVANIPDYLYLYRRSGENITDRVSPIMGRYAEIVMELTRQRYEEGTDLLMEISHNGVVSSEL